MNIFFKSVLFVCVVLFGQQTRATTDVIDFLTQRDLELVDSVNQTHSGVAASLDRTQTKAGAVLLRTMLASPTTDVSLIVQRQQAIKALVDDPQLLGAIKNLLACIALREGTADFFDASKTPVSLTAVIESFKYNTSFLNSLNKSSFALDLRHVTQSFSPLITAVFEFAVLHFALEYLTGGHEEDHHGHHHDDGHVCMHHMHAHEDASWITKALVNLAKAGHIALHLVSIKDMVEFVSAKMAVMSSVYQELQSLYVIIQAADQASRTLQANPALSGIIKAPALESLRSLLNDDYFAPVLDDDSNNLSMLSLVGPTIVVYEFVQKNSADLAVLQENIALLDVYSALATTMLNACQKPAHFCFAEFADSVSPRLEMINGWHVMLDPENVVTNTFKAVDASSSNYILSGPNRSGKSSFLRTIGLNAVLAQSFGIAAADQFTLTPFHSILSFMTIADDLATGQSSFVARMMRADYCQAQQASLSYGQCALVLLDDSVGQGTSAERGEVVAYEFIKQMGAFGNNVLLAATHFDRVKKLGSQAGSNFRNIRMRVVVDPTGVPHGSYVLEEGMSSAKEVGILVDAQ